MNTGHRELRRVHRGELDVTDAEHATLLLSVARVAEERLRGISVRGVGGGPDWLGFETELWEISEDLRAYLKGRRKIRGVHPVLDSVAEIVSDPSYGKGRENFVLVLGQYGGSAYADRIARLLADPDVTAHALSALRKLKDGRFVSEARRVESDPPSPAARREARQYLKVFSDASG